MLEAMTNSSVRDHVYKNKKELVFTSKWILLLLFHLDKFNLDVNQKVVCCDSVCYILVWFYLIVEGRIIWQY